MNVEVRHMENAAEQSAEAQFQEAAPRLPGGSWVRDMRAGAIARFAETGLPHRRIEEWKYTDLRSAIRQLPLPLTVGDGAPAAPTTLADVDAYRITIVDGAAPQSAGEIPGVEIRSLEAALVEGTAEFRALISDWPRGVESPVFDLNTAFMQAGMVIRVKADTSLDKPIHLAFVTTGAEEATVYARNVLVVEDGAAVTFVESYEGPDGVAYHLNTATRFKVGDNARLTYVKAQRDGDAAMHFAAIGGEIGEGANVVLAPITIGAALSRNTVGLRFDGRDTVGNFAGVQMLGGRQHGDTTLFADHKAPACVSRELFKSVLDDRARGVFQGMILVRKDAQETDGKMMSQALMLSDRAEMDNKPELEIYADNVQCGHGATTGAIDDNLLFYLRSRGIPESTAQALLIEAFIYEALEAIGDEAIQVALSAYAHDWVAVRRDTGE
jgi:Fe-S cluster assembly protein SufD